MTTSDVLETSPKQAYLLLFVAIYSAYQAVTAAAATTTPYRICS